MKTIIVDTNVLLRFLLNDIPEQKSIVETFLKKAKAKKLNLVVPEAVIFEINHTLSKYYSYPKAQIISVLEPLVSTQYLDIESREYLLLAVSLYKTCSVSFVDCFLLAKAQVDEGELFTFDKKLQNLQKTSK